jgi:type II secretory pathway component PulF
MIGGSIAVAAVAAWASSSSPTSTEGRLLWHRLQLNCPDRADIVQKREVARFARTLGSLLRTA